MLIWDAESVGDFLGSIPSFEGNSSYVFSFSMLGRQVNLRIFPETNDVSLTIADMDQENVAWQLECSEISYDGDLAEEGGDCLIFKPMRIPLTHWVIIGRSACGFQILTVFKTSAQ